MSYLGRVQVEAANGGMGVSDAGAAYVSIQDAPALVPDAEAATSMLSVGTSSAVLLNSNSSRVGFSVFNLGAGTVYLNWGAAATTTTSFPVPAGSRYDAPGSLRNTQEIQVIADSASQDVRVVEYSS